MSVLGAIMLLLQALASLPEDNLRAGRWGLAGHQITWSSRTVEKGALGIKGKR